MRTRQQKKIFAFILTVIGMFLSSAANAQIVYTDVNPDVTITSGGIYNLDLNNDGISDFTFSIDSSTIICGFPPTNSGPLINASIHPANLNSIALSGSGVCENFSTGATINSSLEYSLISQVPLSSVGECRPSHMGGGYCACHHSEPWSLGLNAYAGLRIQIAGFTHYGWVHLNVENNGGRITIEEYAYNSIPDSSILAVDTICALPTVSNAAISANGATAFCSGGSVTLSVATSGLNYQWKNNGANVSGATSQSFTASVSGSYTCDVSNICGITVSNSISVTDNPKPTVSISAAPCTGSAVVLTCTSTPGAGITFKWRKDGTNISGATNPAYVATQNGTYRCVVTITATGCTKSSKKSTVNITCKSAASNENNFTGVKVSPNPFSQSAIINCELTSDENISLKIYNVEGRLIRTLTDDVMNAGTHELTWNALDENGNVVNPGIYLLRIETAYAVETKELSLMK